MALTAIVATPVTCSGTVLEPFWNPNGTDTSIFDIYIYNSAIVARLHNVEYDIVLYRDG